MTTGEAAARNPENLFAAPAVSIVRQDDGTTLLRSPTALAPYPRCLSDHLIRWAREQPSREFLLERSPSGAWSAVSYEQAFAEVRRVGRWLLSQGACAERPVMILSDNSIEHGLLSLASMHIGAPVASISPAYSLQSQDFLKLKAIVQVVTPAVIFVSDAGAFAVALAAIARLHDATLVVGSNSLVVPAGAARFDSLAGTVPDQGVADAFTRVDGDTVAKLMFTSGSTDEPKGVITTQRMLCSNQQARAQVWPFLESSPPRIVDWLPWSHTFGGSHNFNMILRNGGTLYIDAGRPTPASFGMTIKNLSDVSPTVYFNVPKGYEMLVAALRTDDKLKERFFRQLLVICNAGASLPPHLWRALPQLSIEAVNRPLPVVSSWGATETAPMATDAHFPTAQPGVIGLPVPGCELKLIANGGKLEVRVRGPGVTPGYWRRPEKTLRQFDGEGFFETGDAVRFVDENVPERGLLFDGRIAEDFKLATGVWVSVGTLRTRALSVLAPLAQDIVIAGHDRDEITFLVFPNITACRACVADLAPGAPIRAVLAHPKIADHIAGALGQLRKETPASSTHAARAILLEEPPLIDVGEITDKGYINQRAVLARRQSLVQALYTPDHPAVISAR